MSAVNEKDKISDGDGLNKASLCYDSRHIGPLQAAATQVE